MLKDRNFSYHDTQLKRLAARTSLNVEKDFAKAVAEGLRLGAPSLSRVADEGGAMTINVRLKR